MYLNLNSDQLGGGGEYIMITGTSSSGKTSVCRLFEKEGYEIISGDKYQTKYLKQIYSTLPNKYTEPDQIWRSIVRMMIQDAAKYPRVVFDTVGREIIDELNPALTINNKKLFVVNIYTSLESLVTFMDKRRKQEDPRGKFVFDQFVKKYKKSDTETDMKINRKSFIKKLKESMKYEFSNGKELKKFAYDIFEKMNIDDDEDHSIMLKECADLNINSSDLSSEQIFDIIKTKIHDNIID